MPPLNPMEEYYKVAKKYAVALFYVFITLVVIIAVIAPQMGVSKSDLTRIIVVLSGIFLVGLVWLNSLLQKKYSTTSASWQNWWRFFKSSPKWYQAVVLLLCLETVSLLYFLWNGNIRDAIFVGFFLILPTFFIVFLDRPKVLESHYVEHYGEKVGRQLLADAAESFEKLFSLKRIAIIFVCGLVILLGGSILLATLVPERFTSLGAGLLVLCFIFSTMWLTNHKGKAG